MYDPDGLSPDLVIPAVAFNAQNTGADYHDDAQGNRLRVMCWDGDQPGIGWHYTSASGTTVAGHIPLVGAHQGQYMEEYKVSAAPIGLPTDPDIVTYFEYSKKRWYVVVTFVQQLADGHRALYSIYEFKPKRDLSGPNLTLIPGQYGSIGGGGLEYWEYPQLVSQGTEQQSDCAFSNLDGGLDGYLAFTYASGNHIFGRVRDISGGQLSPATLFPAAPLAVSPANPADCRPDETLLSHTHPDVSIRQEVGERDPVVHFCFGELNNSLTLGGKLVNLVVASLPTSQLLAGTAPACNSYQYIQTRYDAVDDVSDDKRFDSPRITSSYGPLASPEDFVVAVREYRSVSIMPVGIAFNWIDLYTLRTSNSPAVVYERLTDGAPENRIAHCTLTRPAVTAAKSIDNAGPAASVIDWNYNAYGWGNQYEQCLKPVFGNDPRPTNSEVISRTADPATGIGQNPGQFSQVNDVLPGKQHAPSVAGGRATGQGTYYVLHAWLNEPDNSVRYQDAWTSSVNLRPAAPAPLSSLLVAPNPADAAALLTLTLTDPAARITGLAVQAAQPGAGWAAAPATDLAAHLRPAGAGQWAIPVRELLPALAPAGIYALRVQTLTQTFTLRLAYQGPGTR